MGSQARCSSRLPAATTDVGWNAVFPTGVAEDVKGAIVDERLKRRHRGEPAMNMVVNKDPRRKGRGITESTFPISPRRGMYP